MFKYIHEMQVWPIFSKFPLIASYCLNHPCVATHQHYKYQMFIYTGQSIVNLAMSVLFLLLLRRQQKFAVTQTQQQQQQQQPGAINGSKISWLVSDGKFIFHIPHFPKEISKVYFSIGGESIRGRGV
jgi:hypothetical protein